MDAIERKALVKELAAQLLGDLVEKNDPASTTLASPTLHGPMYGNSSSLWGLLSDPGQRPTMYSTLARPDSLGSILTLRASRILQEELEVFTGVTEASGTNATSFVGNPPVVGQGKVARQRYTFGDYYIKTPLEAVPYVGSFKNRADVPRQIVNAGPSGSPLIPEIMFNLTDTQSHLQYQLYLIGVDLQRRLETTYIQGDSSLAYTNTELGFISEFNGLDTQIGTGKTDSKTGTSAPSLDSAVMTFAADVGGTDTNGNNIVQVFSDLMFGLEDRARKFGMDGTQFVVVCRAELHRRLVDQMAVQYNTFRGSGSAGNPINIDDANANNMRIAMLNGRYLLHDGKQVPVVYSEGIAQEIVGNNHFNSDLYVIPVSWAGQPGIYVDYFRMNNPAAVEWANGMMGANDIVTMNNGLWIAGYRSTGLAKEYHFGMRCRLILEWTWLAGRIDDITYKSFTPIRNSDPADTFFYADGGDTYRADS